MRIPKRRPLWYTGALHHHFQPGEILCPDIFTFSRLNFLFSAEYEHTLVLLINRISGLFSPSRRACFLIPCFSQDFVCFVSNAFGIAKTITDFSIHPIHATPLRNPDALQKKHKKETQKAVMSVSLPLINTKNYSV